MWYSIVAMCAVLMLLFFFSFFLVFFFFLFLFLVFFFFFFFGICCFEVLYSQLWNVLPFFMFQMAVGFVGFATTNVSSGVFIINAKESSFSSFCLVSSNAFQAVTSADAGFN